MQVGTAHTEAPQAKYWRRLALQIQHKVNNQDRYPQNKTDDRCLHVRKMVFGFFLFSFIPFFPFWLNHNSSQREEFKKNPSGKVCEFEEKDFRKKE